MQARGELTTRRGVILTVALAAATVVAGCTSPVRLQYSDGRIVECGTSLIPPGSQGAAITQAREAKCIDDHRAQGAVRLSSVTTATSGVRAPACPFCFMLWRGALSSGRSA
jgi:hypothetical protein